MQIKNKLSEHEYKMIEEGFWKGRIDSDNNYDAFRWHQWVERIDINDIDSLQADFVYGVGLIGFCSDLGVERNKGRVGTAKGPDSIRKELMNRPCAFQQGMKIYDFGNLYPADDSLEKIQANLKWSVDRILSLGLFPIVLGGGHAVALGTYLGIREYLDLNKSNTHLGIINFDAHFDIRPYNDGVGTSGTMFRQIADYCQEKDSDFNYLCLGVQKSGNTVDLFKTAHRLGVEYILAKDMETSDLWGLTEKIDSFSKKNEALYLTVCADVFSSAHAPGVSAPQPLGLYPEKVLKLIKYIIRTKKVLGFDIAEVSPRFDMDNTTASLAAIIIFTIVKTLAEENGLEADYE